MAPRQGPVTKLPTSSQMHAPASHTPAKLVFAPTHDLDTLMYPKTSSYDATALNLTAPVRHPKMSIPSIHGANRQFSPNKVSTHLLNWLEAVEEVRAELDPREAQRLHDEAMQDVMNRDHQEQAGRLEDLPAGLDLSNEKLPVRTVQILINENVRQRIIELQARCAVLAGRPYPTNSSKGPLRNPAAQRQLPEITGMGRNMNKQAKDMHRVHPHRRVRGPGGATVRGPFDRTPSFTFEEPMIRAQRISRTEVGSRTLTQKPELSRMALRPRGHPRHIAEGDDMKMISDGKNATPVHVPELEKPSLSSDWLPHQAEAVERV